MGAETNEHIKDLFKPEWASELLDALAEQPRRFGELNARVQALHGHLHDSNQTRILGELRRQGFVGVAPMYEGRRRVWLYHLTPAGASRVNARWAVFAAYDSVMSGSLRCVGDCPHNDTPLLKEVARPYPAIGPADTTRTPSSPDSSDGDRG